MLRTASYLFGNRGPLNLKTSIIVTFQKKVLTNTSLTLFYRCCDEQAILSFSGCYGDDEAVLKWKKEAEEVSKPFKLMFLPTTVCLSHHATWKTILIRFKKFLFTEDLDQHSNFGDLPGD